MGDYPHRLPRTLTTSKGRKLLLRDVTPANARVSFPTKKLTTSKGRTLTMHDITVPGRHTPSYQNPHSKILKTSKGRKVSLYDKTPPEVRTLLNKQRR